jgi:DNA-binding transcriptional LysR family regulator
VHARGDDRPEVIDDVANGLLDLAVTLGPVTCRGVRVTTLFDTPLVLRTRWSCWRRADLRSGRRAGR